MEKYKNIHVQDLSTSTTAEKKLLVCNGRYYEAGQALIDLLYCLQNSLTKEEAILTYINKREGILSYAQVEKLIDRCIEPIFSVSTSSKKTFIYERQLLTAHQVDKFSDTLHFLFNNVLLFPLIVVTILLNVYFFYSIEDLFVFNNYINVYFIVGILLFMFFSSFFHELGHASACKYYGVRHGGIGIGLYLNIPVLYTDVTNIWQLKRSERLVVNIAGVYFQLYLLLILLILFWITESDIFRYLILVINFGFLVTLNPFFKFDGYWIVSDLLGIPNLRERSREWLIYLYRRMRRLPITGRPYLFQLNKISRYSLFIYSIIVNLFMGYYFFYVLPKFFISLIKKMPTDIELIILYLSNNMTPPFALFRNVVMQLILASLISLFIFKSLQQVYNERKGNRN